MPPQIALEHVHSWDVTTQQAREIQLFLQSKVILDNWLPDSIQYVGGVDVGFENENTVTRAAVAVLTFPQLQLHEFSLARVPTNFPYIPGLLSFREVPAILNALQGLKTLPQILLCDGQGIAHPRRLGVASHLGVLTNIPSIGVAKSRLLGQHGKLANEKGSVVDLVDKSEIVGAAVRTRSGVNPIYVSIGHRVSLQAAINIVFRCVTKYRLPETTRWADKIASNRNGEYV